MADEPLEEQGQPALPPIQPPTFNAADPAVAAQVNAVVAQMTAQFEQQRQIVLEQAQAQFQRQLAEMQAQQTIQTYAQHITTPTMQRQHALPLEASAVASFLSGLNATQRTSMARSAAIEAVKQANPALYSAYNASGATISKKGGR